MLWVVLQSFCWRVSRALSSPLDGGGGFQGLSAEEAARTLNEGGGQNHLHAEGRGGGRGADLGKNAKEGGAGKAMMTWAKPRLPSFQHIQDHLKIGNKKEGGRCDSPQRGSVEGGVDVGREETQKVLSLAEVAFRAFAAHPFPGDHSLSLLNPGERSPRGQRSGVGGCAARVVS